MIGEKYRGWGTALTVLKCFTSQVELWGYGYILLIISFHRSVFWMAAFLNNKLILFTHFNSLIFQLYCIPLRYADNGTMTQTSLDSGKYTALRQGWGEEWDRWVMGLMNSALPEMALFWGTNSLRLTLLQAPHCTEPCLQIFASPKAGFRPFSFLTPKAFPKASSLSVWVSYHLLLPCDCVSFMFTMSL